MALATTQDVKRVLRRQDDPIDSELMPSLEAAEALVERLAGRDFDASGAVTERFYNVRQGSILGLKDSAPTAVTVKVFRSANDPTGETLAENEHFQVMPNGRVQLFFYPYTSPTGLPGAMAKLLPVIYERVEIAYTASGVVPAPVREATALIAAALYEQSPSAAGGMTSERLGDYSYTMREGADIPSAARALLRPYRNRKLRSI